MTVATPNAVADYSDDESTVRGLPVVEEGADGGQRVPERTFGIDIGPLTFEEERKLVIWRLMELEAEVSRLKFITGATEEEL